MWNSGRGFGAIDEGEEALLHEFRSILFFSQAAKMQFTEQQEILLQRRFHSFEFTKIYDYLIDAIVDPFGRETARSILRDEYPGELGDLPSHREDLFEDLKTFGIDPETIFRSRPSKATRRTIEEVQVAVFDILGNLEGRELRALATLRFWGEVLNAVEYQQLWKAFLKHRMTDRFNDTDKLDMPISKFYADHIEHDMRRNEFASIGGHTSRLSHSDKLLFAMRAHIQSDGDVDAVLSIDRHFTQIKERFYAQFLAK